MRAPIVVLLALAVPAAAAPHKKPTAQQKEADRLFKNGVALFDEAKFSEALAEFQRAYDVAPAPIVLYNIAACHRELSHYSDAVTFYRRFLSEGAGKVPPSRLAAAKTELDGILAHTARVTVTLASADAVLSLDGVALDAPVAMPIILAPGEHKLVAHVDGKKDAERVVRVASGDELSVALAPTELPVVRPAPTEPATRVVVVAAPPPSPPTTAPAGPKRIRLGVAYGTDLQDAGNTGAPVLGVGVTLGSRIELGVDVVLVAYAVMPSVRVRLAGDQLALHLIGAMPIAFEAGQNGAMGETFVAGAAGLGLRYRATPSLGLHLEGYASFAAAGHGTTFPAFVGGDVWF